MLPGWVSEGTLWCKEILGAEQFPQRAEGSQLELVKTGLFKSVLRSLAACSMCSVARFKSLAAQVVVSVLSSFSNESPTQDWGQAEATLR